MQVLYRDEASAHAAVKRRGVDLLPLCPNEPIATHERGEGITLIYDQLLQGDTPDWLTPVPLTGAIKLFRVTK